MRNQFFCFDDTNHTKTSDYIRVWRHRMDKHHHAMCSIERGKDSLNLIADQLVENNVLRVVKARRQQPELEQKLQRYQDELNELPNNPASIIEANVRLLFLEFNKTILELKQIHPMSLQCREEEAHIDAQLANVQFNIERMELNMEIPENTFDNMDIMIASFRKEFESILTKRDANDRLQKQRHTLAMGLVAKYCTQQNKAEFIAMANKSLEENIAEAENQRKQIDDLEADMREQNRTIDGITNELDIIKMDSMKRAAELENIRGQLLKLHQERFKQCIVIG